MLRQGLVVASLLLLAAAPPARKPPPKPPPFEIPQEALTLFPFMNYTDRQDLKQFSGTMTLVYTAAGSYTFRSAPGDRNPWTERRALDLTLRIRYDRDERGGVITSTLDGWRFEERHSPAKGNRKKGNYVPEYTNRMRQTWSGATTMRNPPNRGIEEIVFSRKLRLAAFSPNLGALAQSALIPVRTHVEKDTITDGKHDPEVADFSDGALGLLAPIPSYGAAPTAWGKAINAKQSLRWLGTWIEGPSAEGETSGGFAMPVWFDDVTWYGAGELRASGIDPEAVPKSPSEIRCWKGQVQVSWSLGRPGRPPGELTIAPESAEDYAKWDPVPAEEEAIFGPSTPVRFTARIKPKDPKKGTPRGKIHFWLTDVSRQKGRCVNYPRGGEATDDLRFSSTQPRGIRIDSEYARHVYTEETATEATVSVEALDTGAWGSLQATCDDLGLVAEDERTHLQSISIPMDDDRNHVADWWDTKFVGLLPKEPESDEETVSGQDAKGDGITLYDEYRGVVVKDGDRSVHRRLEPMVKEMFVLDPDRGLPPGPWKRISHLQAYRLADDLVDPGSNPGRSPLVNFNAEDVAASPFYALKVRTIRGDDDPDPAEEDGKARPRSTSDPSRPLTGYAFSPERGIKGTEYVKVFPDRIRLMLLWHVNWLDAALKNPDSEAGQLLLSPNNHFTVEEAAQALAILKTPKGLEEVMRRLLDLLYSHEVGHTCGDLPDHDGEVPSDEIKDCVMYNWGAAGRRRTVVLTALGRGDPDLAYSASGLCNLEAEAEYQCARKVNVKDW